MIHIYFFCLFTFAFSLNEINIHIIPHTHLDVGWIKTIEEYRSTANRIFNTVVEDLKANPNRTFVFCEIEFFQKWYNSTSLEVKSLLKEWLKGKRIEFVGGGITMNDEGNVYYEHIINNYRSGFAFLSNEFGIKPETGWFLDSFGHTAGNAHISAKLGFKQIVIGRVDKEDLVNRIKEETLEFNWKPFGNEGVFTHLLPFHYGSTQTFAAFFHYSYTQMQDSKLQQWVSQSIPLIKGSMKGLKHNHFLFLIGDDFTYMPHHPIYKNIESYMTYLTNNKKKEGVNVFYSTPAKYFKAVRESITQSQSSITTQYDIDLVPYSCQGNTFWTGYYTSRPYLKGKIRSIANTYLISSKIITELLFRSKTINTSNINQLLNLIGLMQHHDTITGTSSERVSNNYISIGQAILRDVQNHTREVIDQEYLNIKINKVCLSNPIVDFGCRNEFSLDNITSNDMIFGLFNPLIRGKLLISLEFVSSNYSYEVYDENDILIQSDFYCIQDLVFKYDNACYMNFFYLFSKEIELTSFKLKNSFKEVQKLSLFPKETITMINLSTKISKFSFDPTSFSYSLSLLDNIATNYNFKLSLGYYVGFSQGNQCEFNYTNNDGAYIFAPCTKEYTPYKESGNNSYVFKGKISFVTIIRFESGFIISTLFYSPSFMKVDTILDPIRKNNGINIALVLKSDINNTIIIPSKNTSTSTEFWTDSNGVTMLRRITNYRDTFDFNKTQTIASNFYPVVESISIREKKSQEYNANKYDGLTENDRMISIFNDRPQSGSALQRGEIILLINRASLQDDAKGLSEKLYEEISMAKSFKVQHIIMFGKNIYSCEESEIKSKAFMYNFFHNTPVLFNSLQSRYFQSYSVLSQIFTISNNIATTYYFLIKNTVEIQFYCKYDYYYQSSVKNEDSSSYFGMVSANTKGYNVEVSGEYIGDNVHFKTQNLIRTILSRKFIIKIGANDIYLLTVKFLA